NRVTLVSPFHASSELCGTCHNLRNPAFARNPLTGEYEPTAFDTPNVDPTSGFPEQSTYDEWAASAYAASGVPAPDSAGTQTTVSTCQDCHMWDVSGRDANHGPPRPSSDLNDVANATPLPPVDLPCHLAFAAVVSPTLPHPNIATTPVMLRKV